MIFVQTDAKKCSTRDFVFFLTRREPNRMSTRTRTKCVGKATLDAAMAKSGPEQYIVLFVPTHDEGGGVVYTVVTTFLNATYCTAADNAL